MILSKKVLTCAATADISDDPDGRQLALPGLSDGKTKHQDEMKAGYFVLRHYRS
jgi:hypothetical protein